MKFAKTKYESLAEWRRDFDILTMNPNDQHLSQAIIRKVEASSKSVQADIKDFLMSENLIKNPWLVLKEVARENPTKRIMIRTHEDPWFYV